MTLDDLREALGRDLTRDDLRKLEVLAEFHGFDIEEHFGADGYRFDRRVGKPAKPKRRGLPRLPYGIRHRQDCPFPNGARIRHQADGRRRCRGCIQAARHALCLNKERQRCIACPRWFVPTPNKSRTCSKRCRYKVTAAKRIARGERSALCKRGHEKTRPRRDGGFDCRICTGERQRERRDRNRHKGPQA